MRFLYHVTNALAERNITFHVYAFGGRLTISHVRYRNDGRWVKRPNKTYPEKPFIKFYSNEVPPEWTFDWPATDDKFKTQFGGRRGQYN